MSEVEKQLRALMAQAAGKARGNSAGAEDKALAAGEAALQEVLKQEAGASDARLGGRSTEELDASSSVWQERLVAMREAPISLPAGAAYSTHAVMQHLGLALEDGYNMHPVQWVSKYYATPNKGMREACLRQSATMGLCLRKSMPIQCSDEVRTFTKCLRAQGVPATFDLSARADFQPVSTPELPALPAKGRLRGDAGARTVDFSSTVQQLAADLDDKLDGADTMSSAARTTARRLLEDVAKQMREVGATEPSDAGARAGAEKLAAVVDSGSRKGELATLNAAVGHVRVSAMEATDRE